MNFAQRKRQYFADTFVFHLYCLLLVFGSYMNLHDKNDSILLIHLYFACLLLVFGPYMHFTQRKRQHNPFLADTFVFHLSILGIWSLHAFYTTKKAAEHFADTFVFHLSTLGIWSLHAFYTTKTAAFC